MGSLALQPPFPIQILLIFLRFTKSQVLNSRVGRSRDPLLQNAWSRRQTEIIVAIVSLHTPTLGTPYTRSTI